MQIFATAMIFFLNIVKILTSKIKNFQRNNYEDNKEGEEYKSASNK